MILFLMLSCSHHQDVIVGKGGRHQVRLKLRVKSNAKDLAINQAEHYCLSKNKEPYIIKERFRYQLDSLDEKEYNQKVMATRLLGSSSAAISKIEKLKNRKYSQNINSEISQRGYLYTLDFRCK